MGDTRIVIRIFKLREIVFCERLCTTICPSLRKGRGQQKNSLSLRKHGGAIAERQLCRGKSLSAFVSFICRIIFEKYFIKAIEDFFPFFRSLI